MESRYFKVIVRPWVIILLFFVQCHAGKAQDVRIKLENCTLDKKTYDKIRAALSFQLALYSRIFDAPPAREFRARIFKTETAYIEFAKKNINFNPFKENASAFYSHTTKEMILHLEVPDFANVFAHELSHALHHYYAGDSHATSGNDWVHEGMAFMVEDFVITDSTIYLGDGEAYKRRDLVALYEQGMTLEKVYAEVEGINEYILAWSAVYYLYRSNREVLYNIIREEAFESGRLFDSLYPGGMEQLNIDSRSYFLNEVP